MSHNLRITDIRKQEPDIGLFVLALIRLARELQAQDDAVPTDSQTKASPNAPTASTADGAGSE